MEQESILVLIKLLHTAVWLFFAGSIVAIPVAGVLRQFTMAGVLSGLVLGECMVLGLNRGRCPLTDLAGRYAVERHTVGRDKVGRHAAERAANFDIYLPLWLARYNKVIFGSLFVLGEMVVLGQWLNR